MSRESSWKREEKAGRLLDFLGIDLLARRGGLWEMRGLFFLNHCQH